MWEKKRKKRGDRRLGASESKGARLKKGREKREWVASPYVEWNVFSPELRDFSEREHWRQKKRNESTFLTKNS